MALHSEISADNTQLPQSAELRHLKEQHLRARTILIFSLVVHFAALVAAIVAGANAKNLTREIAEVEADME